MSGGLKIESLSKDIRKSKLYSIFQPGKHLKIYKEMLKNFNELLSNYKFVCIWNYFSFSFFSLSLNSFPTVSSFTSSIFPFSSSSLSDSIYDFFFSFHLLNRVIDLNIERKANDKKRRKMQWCEKKTRLRIKRKRKFW